ncbi:unnamed protein product [Echinostoma caproni]|uniref:Metallophos domain-containing protein n=1 Tax=Echinostoma caproni TaxID=27848 RepID=A0A183BF14_9TREM|nr:unnamed protein product [Echinostoma caproni]
MSHSALRCASGRKLHLDSVIADPGQNDFTFVIMADPQLGLLERYVEKRTEPYHWDRDLHCVDRAVALINQIQPRPIFVLGCGDLVDSQPGHKYRACQTGDLLGSLSLLDSSIPFISLPGNHDVGDSPNPSDLADYRDTWGDDYYTFETNGVEFLVLNSQLMWNDSKCKEESREFQSWFNSETARIKTNTNQVKIAFQHIPYFIEQPDEPDDYFNIPLKMRATYLRNLYEAGVRHVFTGHLHRNVCRTWSPSGSDSTADPLHLISTSSVSVQLGPDQAGLRFVQICPNPPRIRHAYYSLDQLETMLHKAMQPHFPS